MADDCLFCKIIAGEIPSTKVYEDEWVYAFEDANPIMPVHVLVVPKEHYDNLNDNASVETLGHVLDTAHKVAEIKGVDQSGYRIGINTGKDAQQTVYHLHMHVLGGAQMSV